jgi:hypothetical protein
MVMHWCLMQWCRSWTLGALAPASSRAAEANKHIAAGTSRTVTVVYVASSASGWPGKEGPCANVFFTLFRSSPP